MDRSIHGKNGHRHPRGEQLASVTNAVRRNSTAAVLFHGAVAEKFRLAATDMKTMEVLDRLGPLTAGELAAQTGLAPTSVTALIDRLEKRRFVRRVRDKRDRRRVIVEIDACSAARLGSVYDSLGHAASKLFASYSDAQLDLITDFLTRGADMVFAQIGKLRNVSGRTKFDPRKALPTRGREGPLQ